MAAAAVQPVPNRIKRLAVVGAILVLAQVLIVESSCTLEPLPMATRTVHAH